MNRLTEEQAAELVDAVYDADPNVDAEIYPDYSGRGMYGETVVGFTTDNLPRFMLALGYAAGQLDIDISDLPTRTDNLGLGTIVY